MTPKGHRDRRGHSDLVNDSRCFNQIESDLFPFLFES